MTLFEGQEYIHTYIYIYTHNPNSGFTTISYDEVKKKLISGQLALSTTDLPKEFMGDDPDYNVLG